MFVLAEFINAIATVFEMICQIILFVVVIRCVMTWFSPDPYNPLVQTIFRITEPMLRPIRRVTGRIGGGIDLSPIVLGILIVFLQSFLVRTLKILALQVAS